MCIRDRFYAEAYELAKQIAGGEQYVISAVMHADERNREASDRLGKDVFPYHMHVIYLPVVEKEIRWSKRCRDPTLRGTCLLYTSFVGDRFTRASFGKLRFDVRLPLMDQF